MLYVFSFEDSNNPSEKISLRWKHPNSHNMKRCQPSFTRNLMKKTYSGNKRSKRHCYKKILHIMEMMMHFPPKYMMHCGIMMIPLKNHDRWYTSLAAIIRTILSS